MNYGILMRCDCSLYDCLCKFFVNADRIAENPILTIGFMCIEPKAVRKGNGGFEFCSVLPVLNSLGIEAYYGCIGIRSSTIIPAPMIK